jgi:AcrR family transcriptional regulator
MVRTWSENDPKAALMTRKRALIVDAALRAFLDHGYAESSVNRIAEAAGVSIKTLYRHFESKEELFGAVMQAACSAQSSGSETAAGERSWYSEEPAVALVLAGEEFLQHVLSEDQLALYRVLTRDAHRCPELAPRYREEIVGPREAIFVDYLDRWLPRMGWTVTDKRGAAAVFASLLKADLFDDALHGRRNPQEGEISSRARSRRAYAHPVQGGPALRHLG